MIVFPHAKINIGLDILRRRADGYHDISTAMVGIDWCDILEITPALTPDKDILTTTGHPVDCPPEKNLVMKAVHALRSVINFPPAHIHLHKTIPDGAGLGGGSADAAFTLTALNTLFQLHLDKDILCDIAASIGSDCPFFIYREPMLATGRGEILEPLPHLKEALNGFKAIVVKPTGCSVPTAAAYAGIKPAIPPTPLEQAIEEPVGKWEHTVRNGFEPVIFGLHPEVGVLKKTLYDMGAEYAAMSGSGSAVYGLFRTQNLPAINPDKAFPGCHVKVCDLLL